MTHINSEAKRVQNTSTAPSSACVYKCTRFIKWLNGVKGQVSPEDFTKVPTVLAETFWHVTMGPSHRAKVKRYWPSYSQTNSSTPSALSLSVLGRTSTEKWHWREKLRTLKEREFLLPPHNLWGCCFLPFTQQCLNGLSVPSISVASWSESPGGSLIVGKGSVAPSSIQRAKNTSWQKQRFLTPLERNHKAPNDPVGSHLVLTLTW